MYAIFFGHYLDHYQACQYKNHIHEFLIKLSFSNGKLVHSHYFLMILKWNKNIKYKVKDLNNFLKIYIYMEICY